MRSFPALILVAACTTPVATGPTPPRWDPDPPAVDCSTAGAALLEAALSDAGLAAAEVGYDATELELSNYASVLDDRFLAPWFRDLQADALSVPCFGVARRSALEHHATLGHPLTGGLWEAMQLLDVPRDTAPLDPADHAQLALGLDALLDATGADTVWDAADLPPGLGPRLGPVFAAMAELVEVWEDVSAGALSNTIHLARYGHGGLLPDTRVPVDLASSADVDWLLSDGGPRALYAPTLRLAHALESADLAAFSGTGDPGVLLSVATPYGEIRVTGPGADAPGEIDPMLFYLDLGGDDDYVHAAGANADAMPLSVMVDLGGDDDYGYVVDPDPNDAGRLPSDRDGRYGGGGSLGPISLSRVGRQGAGRFGVGILVDLGQGHDRYTTLRMGQGWGHLGVGLFHDEGGDDLYEGEAGVQGAGSLGIGLLVDGGGHDTYRAYTDAQGFGFVGAVGALSDRGDGDDTYYADPGKAEDGGDLLYPSAQLAGVANSSFAQGAGFGRRGDADGGFASGGVGLLADGGGDDVYTASVFAQGTGYWQGVGVLADAGGNDSYDAYWYVQGGAAHYAVGALLDGGGDDTVQGRFGPHHVHLGSGHDFSIGVYVDESGDDSYRIASLGAGSSNCQGIGIFADNAGADMYEALSDRSTGLGNHSTECEAAPRTDVESIGLFLDSGGDADAWTWPAGGPHPVPADDSTFGHVQLGYDTEHGGGIDGDGETGLHAIWGE